MQPISRLISFFASALGVLALLSLLLLPLEACTTPKTQEKTGDASNPDGQTGDASNPDGQTGDASNPDGQTDSTPTDTIKTGCIKCEPGTAINRCTGTGACEYVRDCSCVEGKGSYKEGVCYQDACMPIPIKDPVARKSETEAPEAIDLSCLATPPALPQGPDKATWKGPVETFGLAQNTLGVTIDVFDYESDPDLKTSLGSFESATPTDDKTCAAACTDNKVCVNKSCRSIRDDKDNDIGFLEIKDLPTNRLFVIRAKGPGFVDTYQYSIWFPADQVQDGVFYRRAFIITNLTKGLIPAAAGISKIAAGNGALAGEIHDCKDLLIENATVSVTLLAQKLSYFNGLGDNPDPLIAQTNKDAIYAALNVKPTGKGDILLTASVRQNNATVIAGRFKARIFPDSITILTMSPWAPLSKK